MSDINILLESTIKLEPEIKEEQDNLNDERKELSEWNSFDKNVPDISHMTPMKEKDNNDSIMSNATAVKKEDNDPEICNGAAVNEEVKDGFGISNAVAVKVEDDDPETCNGAAVKEEVKDGSGISNAVAVKVEREPGAPATSASAMEQNDSEEEELKPPVAVWVKQEPPEEEEEEEEEIGDATDHLALDFQEENEAPENADAVDLSSRGLTTKEIVDYIFDDSELSDLSDDENNLSFNPQLPGAVNGFEEVVEDEEEEDIEDIEQPEGNWVRSNIFEPLPPAPHPDVMDNSEIFDPLKRVMRYLGNNFFGILSECTNRKFFKVFRRDLGTTELEMKIFMGTVIMMSYLKYPCIKMYWARKTRVSQIADKISRNRFFQIRNNLNLIDNDDVASEERKLDKFWKLQPLLKAIQQACLNNPRGTEHSVDVQMIPFWGQMAMGQYVKGKPNPRGLKSFVCATTDGLPVDFFLYEGKGSTILDGEMHQNLDIGAKAVLRLSRTLPAGSTVYMDRYFTSVHLLDILHSERELQGTGTLQKNRIPTVELKTDTALKSEGRGSHDMMVRDDGQVAVTKWFDNKAIVLASSIEGAEPVIPIQHWCRKTKSYVIVNRPRVVASYYEHMGGIDFLGRVIAMYRISARTKKWTVRVLFHLIDFALAASWIEHQKAEAAEGIPKRDKMDCFIFRINVAHSLLNAETHSESDDSENSESTTSVINMKRKAITPIPHDSLRKRKADHMPEIVEGKPSRCRYPGCRSPKCRIMCTTCKVFLCLNANRNCFKLFHEM